ncbi:hypothetical protein BD769DRAFT_1385341 [Suillus cothurnatus]|nr:hypothetical protein BD769DRAFT_1385341 [Suillus cothurnatus]
MSTKSILINGTNQVIIHDNVIVMDIENLLTGWPTYEIKFMLKNLGPLKLIIQLKDPVKMVHIEDSTNSEAELLIPGSHKRKRTDRKGKKIKMFSANTVKITSQSSSNNSVKAKPVHLLGAHTSPQPHKLKFNSSTTWLPCHPHHFRDMQDKDSIAGLILQAVPAPIKADST